MSVEYDASTSYIILNYFEISYHEILYSKNKQTSLKVGDAIDSNTVLLTNDSRAQSHLCPSNIVLHTASSIENGIVTEVENSMIHVVHSKKHRCNFNPGTFVDPTTEFEMRNEESQLNNTAFMIRPRRNSNSLPQTFIFLDTTCDYITNVEEQFIEYNEDRLTILHNLEGLEPTVEQDNLVSYTPVHDENDDQIFTPFVFGTKIRDAHIQSFISTFQPYFPVDLKLETSEQLRYLVAGMRYLLNYFCFNDLLLLTYTQIYLLQYSQKKYATLKALSTILDDEKLKKTLSLYPPTLEGTPDSNSLTLKDHEALMTAFFKLYARDKSHNIAEFISFEKSGLCGLSNNSFLSTVFLAMLATRFEHFPESISVSRDDAIKFNRLSALYDHQPFESSSEDENNDNLSESSAEDDKVDLNPLMFFFDRFRVNLRFCDAIKIFNEYYGRLSLVNSNNANLLGVKTDLKLFKPELYKQLIKIANFISMYGLNHLKNHPINNHPTTRNAPTSLDLSMTDTNDEHKEDPLPLDLLSCDVDKLSDFETFDEMDCDGPQISGQNLVQTNQEHSVSGMLFFSEQDGNHINNNVSLSPIRFSLL